MIKHVFSTLSPGGMAGRLSVLIFHRVTAKPDDIFPEETDAARFERICAWIRRWFNVVPLVDGIARLQSRSLPPRALAITFDDGYADNHDIALPILQKHGLPATFFVASGFLDGGRMWNDTVVESLRLTDAPSLDFSSLGFDGLTVVPTGSAVERRRCIESLLGQIKYLGGRQRQEASLQISRIANTKPPDGLMMTSRQVVSLHDSGMTIGGHTVGHPILANLSDDEAFAEIAEGKSRLETLVDAPVTLFAYPNGKLGTDFTLRDPDLVRKAGFVAAVTTRWGAADSESDAYLLPRFTPWDHSRLAFAVRLMRNLRAVRC